MSLLQELNTQLETIADGILPSLVAVKNPHPRRRRGHRNGRHMRRGERGWGRRARRGGRHTHHMSGGAGVVWSEDGVIITNAHVVAPSMKMEVKPLVEIAGTEYSAEITAFHPEADIAVLKIDAQELTPASIGNSDELRAGDWITAIGHPYGITAAATSGTIIAVGKHPEMRFESDLIQAGIHLRPGHSGGAMLNDQGELIGINSMIAGPNVGLGIPINTVSTLIAEA